MRTEGGGETTVAGGPDPKQFEKIVNEEKEFLERIQA
jgi:hypothetical protein